MINNIAMTETSSVRVVEQADAEKEERLSPTIPPSPLHSTSDLMPYTIMFYDTSGFLLSHIKLKEDNYEQWATSILTYMRGKGRNVLLMGQ